MEIGMLWFDNSKMDDLLTKINRAVVYYEDKYGQFPNLCFVHPRTLGESSENGSEKMLAGKIEVRPSELVLPNHFWIGIERNLH